MLTGFWNGCNEDALGCASRFEAALPRRMRRGGLGLAG